MTPPEPVDAPDAPRLPRPGPATALCGGDDAGHPPPAKRRVTGSHHGSTSGHGHQHHASAAADRRFLAAALAVLVAFMVVEVIVAVWSGSLALLTDAAHMLSDAGAIAGALWAISLAARPPAGRMTFGWKRAEIIAAGANGVTLVVLGGIVVYEAIGRVFQPPAVAGAPVLVTALVGIAVNLVATALLARADRTSLNIRGAYQHILTDLYGFIGTAVAGVVVWRTGWVHADTIASLLVAALMLRAGWALSRDAGRILLEAAPAELDLDGVREHMLSVPHVRQVHDVHAWTVTSGMPALSAHVVVADECFFAGATPAILDELQACLGGHFDIAHSTFQLEPDGHSLHEASCRE